MNRITKMFFDSMISPNLLKQWEQYGSGFTDERDYRNVVWYWTNLKTNLWRAVYIALFLLTLILLKPQFAGIWSFAILYVSFFLTCVFIAILSSIILKYKIDHFADKDETMENLPDRRFCDDVTYLTRFLKNANLYSLGHHSIHDLELGAKRELVRLAKFVLLEQRDKNVNGISDQADKLREEFKKAHRIFLKFGLVEEKWNKYFNLAEQELEKRQAIPDQHAPKVEQ